MSKLVRGLIIGLVSFLVLPAVGALVSPFALMPSSYIDNARLETVARRYPNFSVAQHAAIQSEIQSEMHPRWQSLSVTGRAKAVGMIVHHVVETEAGAAPVAATFQGNQTAIVGSSSLIGLQRQANCSLTRYDGSLSLGIPANIQLMQTTPNYDKTLHTLSGLTTTADAFANGCVDPILGIGSRRTAYLGKTTQGLNLIADTGYDSTSGTNALFYKTIDPTTMAVQTFSNADVSLSQIAAIAVGDLNGDGIADVVGIDATSGSIGVWLANANGTLGTPTIYPLPGAASGSVGEAAVLADVNGDGKVDIVIATCNQNGCSSSSGQEQLWVLTGKGDGTWNTPQPFNIPSYGSYPLANLIAADLRGTGHPDLIGSNGLVLLNNGSGTFTLGTPAFPPVNSNSGYGPNLAAGDFNHDGKMDLAMNNSATVYIYLGNGDGTFAVGKSYASVNDVGYLTATDLDGDGNIDLYVGEANGGLFGGDQFEPQLAYALMGNADGSFLGAPVEPFLYNGGNLADLNGDKILDAVSFDTVSNTLSTYLGDGKGGFNLKSMLTIPASINGQASAAGADGSFALADVNGDGVPDLVLNYTVNAGNPAPALVIALGDGQGGFGTPSLYVIPSTLAANDIDENWTISNVKLADLNGDGKQDLIYSYTTSSYLNDTTYTGTVVQLGNGNATFEAPQVLSYGSAASSATVPTTSVQFIADLNKDGIPDLVFLGATGTANIYTSSALVQVALGKGDGTFGAPSTLSTIQIKTTSASGAVLIPGDVNGDGVTDILALASDTSQNLELQVYLNKGDGTFGAPVITSFAAQYLNTGQSLAVADFNGDGKLDVAIFDPFTASDSGISLGNGDGTFQTIASVGLPSGGQPTQRIEVNAFGPAASADFNGDGKPDLLVGSTILLSQAVTSVANTATTTSLTAAPTSASVGQSVALTAKVVAVAGTPTGSVSFLDGTTVIGSAALSAQGTATFSTTSLSAGAHALSAQYGGDTTYASSTSGAISVTIGGAASGFGIAASPASGSAAPGGSAETTLTLTPSGGFSGTVTLACSGLPSGAACSFSPASVALNGGAATSTLTISTRAATAQLIPSPSGRPLDPFLPAGTVLAGFAMPFIARRSRTRRRSGRALAVTGFLMVGLAVLCGCHGDASSAGGPATPAGTYTVTVTATSGATSHTALYVLTVT